MAGASIALTRFWFLRFERTLIRLLSPNRHFVRVFKHFGGGFVVAHSNGFAARLVGERLQAEPLEFFYRGRIYFEVKFVIYNNGENEVVAVDAEPAEHGFGTGLPEQRHLLGDKFGEFCAFAGFFGGFHSTIMREKRLLKPLRGECFPFAPLRYALRATQDERKTYRTENGF